MDWILEFFSHLPTRIVVPVVVAVLSAILFRYLGVSVSLGWEFVMVLVGLTFGLLWQWRSKS